MKHIEIDRHVVRDKVMAGELVVNKVISIDNLADVMTKSRHKPLFLDLRDRLLLVDIHGTIP